MDQRPKSRALRVLLLAVALAAVVLVRELWPPLPSSPPGASPGSQTSSTPAEVPRQPGQATPPAAVPQRSARAASPDGDRAVLEAYRARRSHVWLEAAGVVERVLPDDRAGSWHQRFIVGLEGGHTLLVTHNIDLALRVPVARGDSVQLRGEYEWTEQGGVVHWTHHDPDGRMPGGWIRTGGRTYR